MSHFSLSVFASGFGIIVCSSFDSVCVVCCGALFRYDAAYRVLAVAIASKKPPNIEKHPRGSSSSSASIFLQFSNMCVSELQLVQ